MVKAELRGLHGGPNVPGSDLAHHVSPDPDYVELVVTAFLGSEGKPGEESWSGPRATWPTRWPGTGQGHLVARHYLILERYSYERLVGAIQALLDGITGPDWHAVAMHSPGTGSGSSRTTSPASQSGRPAGSRVPAGLRVFLVGAGA
jgi:hypothetical protein